MQMHINNTVMLKTIECEAALSDRVLQAARSVMPSDAGRWFADRTAIGGAGPRNEPLLPLLMALMDATKAVAAAVADNAWDDCRPINNELAADLARNAQSVASDIINATQCPDSKNWSLPSMTGKELV